MLRSKPTKTFLSAAAFLTLAILLIEAAAAYDPRIEQDLRRSRDALLTQKDELERAGNSIDDKVSELQKQRERIDYYLRDTDRALRNIDAALRNN